MGLKDVLSRVREAAPKPEDSISDIADAFWKFLSARGGKKDSRRAVGYHPSAMGKFCPRLEILRHFFPKPEVEHVDPSLQMIFDWGSSWQDWVRDHYFGPMGILWGTWKCVGCGRLEDGSFLPHPCAKCFGTRVYEPKVGGFWHYIEPGGVNREWDIPWHSDGYLILSKKQDGQKELLEIKTINAYGFKQLRRPDPYYVVQVNLYLWLTGLRVCWVTYWTKEDKQVPPKVFKVEFDQRVVDEILRQIVIHKRAWPEKRLCEGVCKTDQEDRAVDCAWRGECFRKDIEELVEKMRGGTK